MRYGDELHMKRNSPSSPSPGADHNMLVRSAANASRKMTNISGNESKHAVYPLQLLVVNAVSVLRMLTKQ